jgi:hypothetical protein
MSVEIKVIKIGDEYRANVVQPPECPPMVGSVGKTMAEAVRGVCVLLNYRGDFIPKNRKYKDGSRGHLPEGMSVTY